MQICVDLHSHSGYAGGVGDIQLKDIVNTMSYKGIDVFGTGDCLFPKRTKELRHELKYEENQLYKLNKADNQSFLLQTEVIFSVRLTGYKHKIVAHHIIFFPDFESIEKMALLMTKWSQKNTIGRPFIVCENQKQLEDRLFEIQNIHPLIEIIPAHIMTPDGLMGSKNMLTSMKEFYGQFFFHIHALETGLSADPEMLSQLNEINQLTMLSFSDCHSAALNRIGREFTVLDCEHKSYGSIIQSIRQKKVVYTAEFNPAEGRYFLTGHRAGKNHHEKDLYYTEAIPQDHICPICGKKLTIGVNDRCQMLQKNPINSQKYVHLIPLIDVLAYALKQKSISSKKVIALYEIILKNFESEIDLWETAETTMIQKLDKISDKRVVSCILAVKQQQFSYDPPGFDGMYGQLKINCKDNLSNV
ncbi:MAG TPA: endonuclease Q family protein [Candidatus Cloacimonadota bacterium]|nr:endonuclease Q family protein [Candidatus Cloacimonadota bacterium]HPM01037.1 endonuclease Q family protein [Candidatus Cloacimonadota bacterium]